MSRWTHGMSPTKHWRKAAAVSAPAGPAAGVLDVGDRRRRCRLRYSFQSGSGQTRSPVTSPAWRISPISPSSLPIAPLAWCPSATTQAPVSVARSMIASGLLLGGVASASERITRPSASVFTISIVLPLVGLEDVARLVGRAAGQVLGRGEDRR